MNAASELVLPEIRLYWETTRPASRNDAQPRHSPVSLGPDAT
jgi:hypothetical protein